MDDGSPWEGDVSMEKRTGIIDSDGSASLIDCFGRISRERFVVVRSPRVTGAYRSVLLRRSQLGYRFSFSGGRVFREGERDDSLPGAVTKCLGPDVDVSVARPPLYSAALSFNSAARVHPLSRQPRGAAAFVTHVSSFHSRRLPSRNP
ncbi:hypothetical protein MTO96_048461 [Rhipicephalus appendiculatus]